MTHCNSWANQADHYPCEALPTILDDGNPTIDKLMTICKQGIKKPTKQTTLPTNAGIYERFEITYRP